MDARAAAVWPQHERGPARRYEGHGQCSKAPRCVACFPRSVAGQMIPFRYGVAVALCDDHRDPAFVHSRGSPHFSALTTTYESLGLRGRLALERHPRVRRRRAGHGPADTAPTHARAPTRGPISAAPPPRLHGRTPARTTRARRSVLTSFAALPPSVVRRARTPSGAGRGDRRWLTPRPALLHVRGSSSRTAAAATCSPATPPGARGPRRAEIRHTTAGRRQLDAARRSRAAIAARRYGLAVGFAIGIDLGGTSFEAGSSQQTARSPSSRAGDRQVGREGHR